MTIKAKRPSTRQSLVKIPNYPCLYRHDVNNTYYGIKKHGGKRKEHSLQTDDRKIAERNVNWDKGEHGELTVRRKKTTALFYPPIYAHLKPLMQKLYGRYETPPAADTKVFTILDARKSLTNACKRLGFPHFTQRSIRAYLIRRLWQSGVDIKLIAKWQGHNDGEN